MIKIAELWFTGDSPLFLYKSTSTGSLWLGFLDIDEIDYRLLEPVPSYQSLLSEVLFQAAMYDCCFADEIAMVDYFNFFRSYGAAKRITQRRSGGYYH